MWNRKSVLPWPGKMNSILIETKSMNRIFLFILIAIFGYVAVAWGEPVYTANVKADLITDVSATKPGSSFWVSLKMEMDDGWHTYWRNSGDSGLPTSVQWDLPDGYKAGGIHWPIPQRFEYNSGLVGYGYEGEVLLLMKIQISQQLESGEISLMKAKVTWLSCAEICVPGKAAFALPMVVINSDPIVYEDIREQFNKQKARLPVYNKNWQVDAIRRAEDFVFRLRSLRDKKDIILSAVFFPYKNDIIDHAAKQEFVDRDAGTVELIVKRSNLSEDWIQGIQGVMVLELFTVYGNETQGIIVDVPVIEQ